MVVLPEHLHCIWQLPLDDNDHSTRWSSIKAGFSRRLPATEHIRLSRGNKRERDFIIAALKRNGGNVTRAAAELGVGRTYLHRRLASFGITKSEIF